MAGKVYIDIVQLLKRQS